MTETEEKAQYSSYTDPKKFKDLISMKNINNLRYWWEIAEGRITGNSHDEENLPCQDYIKSTAKKNSFISLIALSDGAGSVNSSHIGAEGIVNYVCTSFSKWLKKNNDKNAETIKKELALGIVQKLKEIANNNKVEKKDLACTMLFAAVVQGKYIIGHIGDGLIAALHGEENNEKITVLSEPENGKYINETFFVTDDDMEYHLRIKTGSIAEEKIRSFVIMSDGTTNGIWKKETNTFIKALPIIMDNVARNKKTAVSEIKHLLQKIKDVSTDDDCSIAIMTKSIK